VVTPRNFRPLVQVTALHLLAHDTPVPELLGALRRQFPRTAEPLLVSNLLDAWGQLPVRLRGTPDAVEVDGEPRRVVKSEKGLQRLENYVNWYREAHGQGRARQ
jgi:hypothetical protein